jgi:hypothetical protein
MNLGVLAGAGQHVFKLVLFKVISPRVVSKSS